MNTTLFYRLSCVGLAAWCHFSSARCTAETERPLYADINFASEAEPNLPNWITGLRNDGGEFGGAPGCWHVSGAAELGIGRFIVELDRSQLVHDLALSLVYEYSQGVDISIQLMDSADRVVAIDLFQNIVALGKEAQTDTFIIPLSKYPDATQVVVRRVSGNVRVQGLVLWPVVGEIASDVQSHAELAKLFGDPLAEGNSLERALRGLAGEGNAGEGSDPPPIDGVANLNRMAAAAKGIDLLSSEGERHVGHQLSFFDVTVDGVITTKEKTRWIYLYYTEGKSFRLTGQVMLAQIGDEGRVFERTDHPDGFALFLREATALHRYGLNSRRIRVKRSLLEGVRSGTFEYPCNFSDRLEQGTWHPFSVEASPEQISFSLGGNLGIVEGPLDFEGANKIVLAPGAKLKDLTLTVSD